MNFVLFLVLYSGELWGLNQRLSLRKKRRTCRRHRINVRNALLASRNVPGNEVSSESESEDTTENARNVEWVFDSEDDNIP